MSEEPLGCGVSEGRTRVRRNVNAAVSRFHAGNLPHALHGDLPAFTEHFHTERDSRKHVTEGFTYAHRTAPQPTETLEEDKEKLPLELNAGEKMEETLGGAIQ